MGGGEEIRWEKELVQVTLGLRFLSNWKPLDGFKEKSNRIIWTIVRINSEDQKK